MFKAKLTGVSKSKLSYNKPNDDIDSSNIYVTVKISFIQFYNIFKFQKVCKFMKLIYL